MKAIKAQDISGNNYEGWYWLSDETAPIVLERDSFPTAKLVGETAVVVVEAQLWDNESHTSISIRYADGRHYITQYNLAEIPAGLKSQECSILGHRLGGRNLRVTDLWQETEIAVGGSGNAEAATGETMKTRVPLCSVFTGFEKVK